MLQVLVESRAPRPRRGSWTAASFLAHAAVIGLAVYVTTHVAPTAPRVEPVPDIIYVAPPPAPRTAAPSRSPSLPGPISIAQLVFTVPNVDAPSFPVPQTDLRRLIEDLGRTTVGTINRGNPGVTVREGGVHTAESVDRVVAPLRGNPSPAYPVRLSNAGVEGHVTVGFVVDTAGRVEAASVQIIEASHALFGEAVRRWLELTRYEPALANGRAVRQLVRQRVGFTLAR